MKKALFFLSVATLSVPAAAQGKFNFGAKLFPSIGWSRVGPERFIDYTAGDTSSFSGNGLKMHGGFGVFLEYYFAENYAFVSGINYIQNGSGFEIVSNTAGSAGTAPFNSTTNKYSYNLKYLQIPLCIKALSNELPYGFKVYGQAGITLEYLVGASMNGYAEYQPSGSNVVHAFSDNVNNLHSGLVVSPGIEYELGNGVMLLFGLTYYRGLLDVDNSASGLAKKYNSFDLHNDYLSIDFGIKF